MSDIRKIFDFTKFVNSFKYLERYVGATYWKEYPLKDRFESDADHTWRMAMMLSTISSRLSKPLDYKRTMDMILIHDIPEINAGDFNPMGKGGTGSDGHAFNEKVANEKHEREKIAAREIFDKLPTDLADYYYELWLEFEAGKTLEAQVATAIDKLEGKLQQFQMQGEHVYPEHHKFNMIYGVETFTTDPTIQELGDLLLKELADNYIEYKE